MLGGMCLIVIKLMAKYLNTTSQYRLYRFGVKLSLRSHKNTDSVMHNCVYKRKISRFNQILIDLNSSSTPRWYILCSVRRVFAFISYVRLTGAMWHCICPPEPRTICGSVSRITCFFHISAIALHGSGVGAGLSITAFLMSVNISFSRVNDPN